MIRKALCFWGCHIKSSINLGDCVEVYCLAEGCTYRRWIVAGKEYK